MQRYSIFVLLLTLLAVNAYAVPINLGTASTFGLLAGSGISNVGSSVIIGDVGSSPTPAVTGFPPGIVIGTLYTVPNAVTAQAQIDLTTAYNQAASTPTTMTLTGVDLNTFGPGNPLGPGVYFFATSAQLTGNLTLDGQGDPNAQWIFKIGSTLTTGPNSSVSFINGASPCNVFWQVGSSATIDTNNVFGGTIMALTSITLNGGTLNGRALARNGAVSIAAAEFVNTVCPIPSVPCVTIGKIADRDVASAGELITYTYTVCNCGTVPITVGSVVDSRLGNLTADFITANGGTAVLAPGVCTLFTESYMVQVTDTSPLVNTATVVATGNGLIATDTAQESVIITVPGPCVTVEKSANVTQALVGDTIIYSYTVCNCGTEPLTVTSVVDSRLGDLIADFIVANGGSAILAIDTCVTLFETVTVDGPNPSPLTNTVTVSATNGVVIVTDTDQASVSINPGARCFLPVTLTQQNWHDFAVSAPGVPGGLIFNVFPSAFAKYSFFGTLYFGQAIIGAPPNVIAPGSHSITFTATTAGLKALTNFLPQTGPADRLWRAYVNPSYLLSRTGAQTTNVLAGEVLALTLNIAYNDMRLMPRSRGYDLEKFIVTQGLFRGKTVGQVWNIANAVLAGAPPRTYGLLNMNALVSILQSINANYEFANINTFIDRGYLKPNVPLGQPGPPHMMIVPF